MKAAWATKTTGISAAPTGVLQRKCACGAKTSGGSCAKCQDEQKRGLLQRSATRGGDFDDVPPIVHEVLREPGQLLDAQTRAFFEPRFGADFSGVRVHTGAKAAESAGAVGARAYTVGRDVAFALGEFAPQTTSGKRLLAHELGHTLQQPAVGTPGRNLEIGPVDSAAEREADRAGTVISQGGAFHPVLKSPPQVARDIPIPDELDSEQRRLAEDYLLERRLRQQARLRDSHHAGRTLTDAEKNSIETLLKQKGPSGPPLSFTEGPRFVLHDPAGRAEGKDATERATKDRAHFEEVSRASRGPLGEAAAAYVPTEGAPIVARPNFFDSQRPTASQYERRADLMSRADREAAFQEVWIATKTSEQQAALGGALAGLELSPVAKETPKQQAARSVSERKMTPGEVKAEQDQAKRELVAPLPAKQRDPNAANIHTTGAWTVEAVCAKLATVPAKQLTDTPAAEKKLQDGCNKLAPYFAARAPRLSSEVNVEILQEKGPAGQTISPKTKPADIPRFPTPAYTDTQYQGLVTLYLQAALQAGQYPEITTHYWLDRVAGDHWDPRCFDLPRLYALIAAALGHAKGSTYGITPQYGTTRGTSNLWWHDVACGGPHP